MTKSLSKAERRPTQRLLTPLAAKLKSSLSQPGENGGMSNPLDAEATWIPQKPSTSSSVAVVVKNAAFVKPRAGRSAEQALRRELNYHKEHACCIGACIPLMQCMHLPSAETYDETCSQIGPWHQHSESSG